MVKSKKLINNKYFLLIILIILFILFLIFSVFNNKNINNNANKINKSQTDLLIEKIKKGKVKSIYIKNSKNCEFCQASDNYLRYYKRVYNLKYETYNIGVNSKSDIEKLFNFLNLYSKDIHVPAFIIIRDEGNIMINEIENEENLQSYLIENNIINKDSFNNEIFLNDLEFENMLKKDDRFLMFIRNEIYSEYDFRENIYKLSVKYNFKYYTSVHLFKNGGTASLFLITSVKDYKVPILFIIEKGRVIDYIYSSDSSKIKQFLKKNKFINNTK